MLMTGIFSVLSVFLILVGKKNIKITIIFISIVLTVIAGFYFHPTPETDLQRYYDIIGFVKSRGWSTFELFEYTKGLYLFQLSLYILAIYNAETYLPIITVAICYLMFLLFLNSKMTKISKEKVTEKKKVLVFYLIILPFYQIICGIRFWISSTFFLMLLYTDIVEKKHRKLCFVVYIILTQFHTSAYIFLAFRILLYLGNRLKRNQKMFISILIIFYQPIMLALYKIGFFNIFSSSAFNLVYRLQFYLTGTEQFSKAKYIFAIINLLYVFILLRVSRNKIQRFEYRELLKYIVCFSVGGYYNFDLFYRFSYISLLFSFPFLYKILSTKKTKDSILIEVLTILVVVLNMFNHVYSEGYNMMFL
ncbi:EpsG family protein [Enterococcus italicus]|uniref:EpsG family protein n=1 Tax=Enterococcus italicus TaxID=246144 RepID=UPI003F460238